MHQPRHTGRGIVVQNGYILLMERWRPGLHYYSLPGGGIETRETPEQAALREIAEETTIAITIDREVLQMHDGMVTHHIFLCTYISGEPYLPSTAPEARNDPTINRFKPGWFAVETLGGLDMIYWQPIKQALIDGLVQGFADEVLVVSAAASG